MKVSWRTLTIFSWTSWLFLAIASISRALDRIDPKSPLNLRLPDCIAGNYTRVFKKTDWKGLVCPMIKDEVGFLAEWTAFYEMMGFDHVIFFDNNSTTSLSELDPWISSGFAEIVAHGVWWEHDKALQQSLAKGSGKRRFQDMMRVKFLSEVFCKRKAIELKYDIFLSVDLDEYVFPLKNTVTLIDEMAEWFSSTKRRVMALPKLNFNPIPHFLEPINLLVVEAFLVRMKDPDRMNYYKNIMPKVALWLSGRDNAEHFSNKTVEYIVNCCDFHGCRNYDYKPCSTVLKDERWNLEGKHFKWKDTPHIHHYARSMEKFMLKQRTWDTASAENSRGYDLYAFLDRTVGHTYDDSALAWTCQLREVLRNRTSVEHFLRAGDFWYRNPEFGRTVSDPRKRGRNGAGFGKYLSWSEMNPYPPGDTYQKAHRPYDPKSEKKSQVRR